MNESNVTPSTVASETQSKESEILCDFIFGENRNGKHIPIKQEDSFFGLSAEDQEKIDTDYDEASLGLEDKTRLGKPSYANLARTRRKLSHLSAEEEAALIIAAQAENTAAAAKLLRHHEPELREKAFQKWKSLDSKRHPQRASTREDFVSVAIMAFLKAVRAWKPGNRLNTFYRHYVHYDLIDAAHDWRNANGFQAETDVVQFLRSHPYVTISELQQKFPDKSAADLRWALTFFSTANIRTKYSESSKFDADDSDGNFMGNDTSVDSYPVYGRDTVGEATRGLWHPSQDVEKRFERELGIRCCRGWADAVIAERDRRTVAKIRDIGRVKLAQDIVEGNNANPSPTPLAESGAVIASSGNHSEPKPAKPAAKQQDTTCLSLKVIGGSGQRHTSNTTFSKSPEMKDAA